MNTKLEIIFHGPYPLCTEKNDVLFDCPYASFEGIYLWAVRMSSGVYRVSYLGQTIRSFYIRNKEHLIQQLGGNYQVCDPEAMINGRHEVVWNGMWRKGTQSAIDRKRPAKNIKRTVNILKEAFDDLADNELGHRLRKILDWAVNKQAFMTSVAIKPTFGIQGKSKDRIMTLSSNGDIYSFMSVKQYPGGVTERDALVDELKQFGLLDQDLDPNQVVSGRYLSKKLYELSDDDIDKLLDVYGKYCG
jgi:hypothetical protein